ncbi:hypothetical protein COB55_00265 [Candidatus Wolfebacteria bacterium]|nr:MAG: hypothetical protein COB55_00265 [Candidatus Wolfebacteria bacterium]
MSKKILIFSTNYLPNIGGAEIAVKHITDKLGAETTNGNREYHFDMIVPRIDGGLARKEDIGVVTIHRVGMGINLDKFLVPFLGYFKAVELHRINKYDTVWSIMASQASIAAAFFKMSYKNVPLVLTLQEGDEEDHLKRYVGGNTFLYNLLIRPWHNLVFKKADLITAISNYLKTRALEKDVEASIKVIPNGVDIELFSQTITPEQKSTIASKLGKREDDKFLITTSRLVKKNSVKDIIDSLVFLPEEIKLVVIGGGAEYSSLRERAHDKKVAERVQFLGPLDQTEVARFLSVGDVFVRTPISEGFGNVFVEAMAAGLPVVATNVGGISDFLENEKTGLFVDVENPEDIAEKVKILLKDNRLRKRLITAGQKLVKERYDWSIVAKEMSTALSDIEVLNKINKEEE